MSKNTEKIKMTLEQYLAMGATLFGENKLNWRVVCPGCGHVASIKDYQEAGAPEGAVGFSCIGRFLDDCRDWLGGSGSGPCNYTGGGLININPIHITDHDAYLFAFAEEGDR